MRDPSLMTIIEETVDEETLEINSIPEFDTEDYDLFDKKDFARYIDRIEKSVRTSYEYRAFINFIRDNMEMNQCSFFKNISNAENYKIKIEIHHDPITLYDLVLIVYNKRCSNQESIDEELVAKEVMYLHYNLLVGLIPLSKTVHHLVHKNYLFIPLTDIMGRWQEFISLYKDYIYIQPEIEDKIDRAVEFTKSYNEGNIADTHILDKKYIYLDTSGAYKFPQYQDILNGLNKSLNDIQNNTIDVNKQYENTMNSLKPLLSHDM